MTNTENSAVIAELTGLADEMDRRAADQPVSFEDVTARIVRLCHEGALRVVIDELTDLSVEMDKRSQYSQRDQVNADDVRGRIAELRETASPAPEQV